MVALLLEKPCAYYNIIHDVTYSLQKYQQKACANILANIPE